MLRELKGSESSYKTRVRRRRQKFLTRLIITSVFIGMSFIIAGTGYAWYMNKKHPASPVVVQPQPTTVITPAKRVIADTTPVGVSIQSLTSPAAPGSNASVSIKTLPTAACSIKVTYKEQVSTDTGLIPKSADEFGMVNWTWTIEQGRPLGTWPVEITCAHGKMSGAVKGDLVLQKTS